MSPSRRSTRGGLGARRRPPRRWGLWHLVLSRMAEAQACEDSGRRRPRPAPLSTRLSPKRPSSAPFLPPASARRFRPPVVTHVIVLPVKKHHRAPPLTFPFTSRVRKPLRNLRNPPRRLRYPPTPSPLAEKSFAGRGLDVCDLNEGAAAAPCRDDIMDPEEGCARAPHPARAAGAGPPSPRRARASGKKSPNAAAAPERRQGAP